MNGVTIDKLADLRRVSVRSAYKAKAAGKIVIDEESGLYDLDNPINTAWIRKRPQSGAPASKRQPSDDSGGLIDLETQKLREEVLYKQRQSRKLDRDHDVAMQKLVPAEIAAAWLAAYSAGVRTHLLEIPARIVPDLIAGVQSGRTAEELRASVASEISDSLNRAMALGDHATREIVATIEEEGDDADADEA